MFKRFHINNRSVLITWLISYLSVLLVPILIGGAMYWETLRTVEGEINRTNESLLAQIDQAIDNKLKGLEQLSLEVALNKKLSNFMSTGPQLTDEDRFQLFSIAEDLRIYKMSNDLIDQIYVYYKNSDTVLSTFSRMSGKELLEKIIPNGMLEEDWTRFFNRIYVQEYLPVTASDEEGNPQRSVLYTRSILGNQPGTSGAVIIFVIKDEKFLENISFNNDHLIYILDKKNQLISTNGPDKSLPDNLTYESLTGAKGLLHEELAGTKMVVSYTTSEITGWKYVSLVPEQVFNEKMNYMKTLTWLCVFLCLVFGGIMTMLFLRRNYSPIHTLIENVSQKASQRFDSSGNEFAYLRNVLHDTFEEKEEVQNRLKKHHNAIRSHCLRRLLKGQAERGVPWNEALVAHDIQFHSEYFAVIVFQIEHFGKYALSTENVGLSDQPTLMLHFILTNILEELGGPQNRIYTADMEDSLACIVNMVSDDPKQNEAVLLEIAKKAQVFMRDYIQVELTVAISGQQEGLFGISRAYQEALEAMEYRIVMGSGEIILHDGLQESDNSSYHYPLSMEQELIYHVKTGNFAKAEGILNELFDRNFTLMSLSVPMARCLMFDLVSTMLKTMDEIGESSKRDFFDQIYAVDRLMKCETVKEMKTLISGILEQVCRFVNEERKNHHKHLVEEIRQFVTDHYQDNNLNISMIGEAFSLTPSYLSRIFKDYTGEVLLDYINKTRLKEAKELLISQKYTVNEVAGLVGYQDINTFMRIFKKLEGVTPGKYVKSHET